MFGERRVTSASVNQMFDPEFEGFNDEKLLLLLDPDSIGIDEEYSKLSDSNKIKKLNKAFAVANETANKTKRVSEIQDRLIAASDQRCNLYTTYLKRISEYTNGTFGTLTTVLGGAGAIVTGATSARVLSGLAGISSGTRAELNQATFESISTSVIIPGIQKTRDKFRGEMHDNRKDDNYTVEGAIADVIRYHGACSMDTGIAYAQKSIQLYDDVGVDEIISTMKKLKEAKKKELESIPKEK